MKKIITLLFLFCFSTAQFVAADDRPEINWVIFEQVPYFIVKGENKGQGVGDRLLDRYIKSLPDFEHRIKVTNIDRYRIEIQRPNTCIPLAWITDDEASLIQTRPHTIEPPMGIFTLKRNEANFGSAGSTLSLAALLKDERFTLGAIDKMSYGKRVEKLLAEFRESSRVKIFKTPSVELNLHMLGQRVDYLLGIPSQMANEIHKNGSNPYLFYNIEEIDNYIDLYTHCPNDPFGRSLIPRLNNVLTKSTLKDMLESYQNWYGPNDLFRSIFQSHIIDQVPHPLVRHNF